MFFFFLWIFFFLSNVTVRQHRTAPHRPAGAARPHTRVPYSLAAGPGGLSSADLRRIPRGRLQARLRAPWRRSAAAEGRADIITSAGTAGTAAAPHYRKWRRSRRK